MPHSVAQYFSAVQQSWKMCPCWWMDKSSKTRTFPAYEGSVWHVLLATQLNAFLSLNCAFHSFYFCQWMSLKIVPKAKLVWTVFWPQNQIRAQNVLHFKNNVFSCWIYWIPNVVIHLLLFPQTIQQKDIRNADSEPFKTQRVVNDRWVSSWSNMYLYDTARKL